MSDGGAVAIVVAAGTSTRLGGAVPKQFLELGGTVRRRAVAVRSRRVPASRRRRRSSSRRSWRAARGRASRASMACLRSCRGRHAHGVGAGGRRGRLRRGYRARARWRPPLRRRRAGRRGARCGATARRRGPRRSPCATPCKRGRRRGIRRRDTRSRDRLRLAQTPQGAQTGLDARGAPARGGLGPRGHRRRRRRSRERDGASPWFPAIPQTSRSRLPADWSDALRRFDGDDDVFAWGTATTCTASAGRARSCSAASRFPASRARGTLRCRRRPARRDGCAPSEPPVFLTSATIFRPDDPRFAGADSATLAREVGGRASSRRLPDREPEPDRCSPERPESESASTRCVRRSPPRFQIEPAQGRG